MSVTNPTLVFAANPLESVVLSDAIPITWDPARPFTVEVVNPDITILSPSFKLCDVDM